ncbi:hypothetical protein EV283_0152 [Sphingomonas sp. BK036]|nr:hypothetical protein EV283_0152 [Sphingomonas sp. BK036]
MRRAVSGLDRPVILTKVRIQGYGMLPCLALDPDFRQNDGGFATTAPTPLFHALS